MVLLVLAIVWGVLLVSWLRSRTNGTFYDSVGTFRRHLTVLERATPAGVHPANRLRTGPMVGRPVRPSPVRSRLPGPPDGPGRAAGLAPAPSLARSAPASPGPEAAARCVLCLLAGVVGTFLLAIIPGLSVMWSVQVLFDLLLVGYVALLVRMRNLAAERELKLTFMPQQTGALRPRATYDFGNGGYGELGLRRAAN